MENLTPYNVKMLFNNGKVAKGIAYLRTATQEKAPEEFMSRINGTEWLTLRTDPAGTEHISVRMCEVISVLISKTC